MPVDNLPERLRSLADRCRLHAENASDPEVAKTLLELVEDIEVALPLLSEDARV